MARLPVVGSDLGTWGSLLNDFLDVGHNADGSLYNIISQLFNVKDYGAVGDGSTEDATAIQNAINAALTATGGGIVYFPPGTYKVSTVLDTREATNRTLILMGAGMYDTVLLCGQSFQFNGLIGYYDGNQAQLVVMDLTVDGNYSGQGGTIAQQAGNGLVSLAYPFTNAMSVPAPWVGRQRHFFHRVRFYRPSGYVFQPTNGVHLHACLFDKCGQPELAVAGTHYDIIGSGDGDAIVEYCTFLDSSGNYCDFIWATDTSRRCRLVFTHNESYNHQIGGIYLGGDESVVAFNRLRNGNTGSGVSYDSGTHSGIRGNNRIAHNYLINIALFSGPAWEATDRLYNNKASDQPQGAASVSPGASPWTYTAGPTPEVLHLRGGTVSDVSKNSVTLYVATPCAIPLEPQEAVVVTYSSAPTAVKDRK